MQVSVVPRARVKTSWLAAAVIALAVLAWPSPSNAHAGCHHSIVFTLPGITWHDIRRVEPPEILEVARLGSIGSMSVRTNSPRTSYASGFATLGAGARVDGGTSSGGAVATLGSQGRVFVPVTATGVEEMRRLLDEADYTSVEPGALAEAMPSLPGIAVGNSDVGRDPPIPEGWGRWSLLAAMDVDGEVDLAATGPRVLSDDSGWPYGVRTDLDLAVQATEDALAIPCSTIFVDPGDLVRADHLATAGGTRPGAAVDQALSAADQLLGEIRDELDPRDLLIVVSPTVPGWDPDVHFGVVIVQGPNFPAGTVLESPTTRRPGMVTLPDVAPTVLAHAGVARPSSMLGRAMFARGAEGDRIEAAAELDSESVFIDKMRVPVATGFVIAQVLLYALVMLWLVRGEDRTRGLSHWVQVAAFIPVAFPVSTYLAGFLPQAKLGSWGFLALLVGIDIALVIVTILVMKTPLDRLLLISGITFVVLVGDLFIGAPLQLNTVFSYSPLVAGRFSGIGNIAYSVLAAVTVIVGAVLVHRHQGSRSVLIAAAVVFAVAVIADGAPTFGADVGGILALVPGLALTWMFLARKRVSLADVVIVFVGLLVALAVFLAVDLALPERLQTHLARLFEAVRAEGLDPFVDVVRRKIETNLRVFTSTIWTYLVPPALILMGWLLIRSGNGWRRLAESHPRLRAGLVGGLLLAGLGFAVNDSGIVVPAMMLTFLVPLALFVHLASDQRA
jgi:hypothetical protein